MPRNTLPCLRIATTTSSQEQRQKTTPHNPPQEGVLCDPGWVV